MSDDSKSRPRSITTHLKPTFASPDDPGGWRDGEQLEWDDFLQRLHKRYRVTICISNDGLIERLGVAPVRCLVRPLEDGGERHSYPIPERPAGALIAPTTARSLCASLGISEDEARTLYSA